MTVADSPEITSLARYHALLVQMEERGVPEHLRDSLAHYIVRGLQPGRFVTAVLSNNLLGAFRHGDEDSLAGLRNLVTFMVDIVPGTAWGSHKHVAEWKGLLMQAKVLEILDRCTFIPALAIRQSYPLDRSAVRLLARAGFGTSFEAQCDYVLLIRLSDMEAQHDCHKWGNRTMLHAHLHIASAWDDLEHGSVIDIEFILGETDAPKVSEVQV